MLSASAYSRRPFLGARLWQGTMQQTHACLRTFLTSFPTRHSSQLGPIPKSWTQYSNGGLAAAGICENHPILAGTQCLPGVCSVLKGNIGLDVSGLPCPDMSTAGNRLYRAGPTSSVYMCHGKWSTVQRIPLLLIECTKDCIDLKFTNPKPVIIEYGFNLIPV